MDLLFQINSNYVPRLKRNGKSFCSVSSSGLVAFTSVVDVVSGKDNDIGHFVFVFDINLGWKAHKVLSSKFPITLLKWDHSGKLLFTADTSGYIKLWGMKNYEINAWKEVAACCLSGEHILDLCLFHTGKRLLFAHEKQDKYSYIEKYYKDKKMSPSVTKIGGVSVNGFMVVTSTGMIGACIIPTESILYASEKSISLNITLESLGLTRTVLTIADISYGKQHFYIVVGSPNCKENILSCYKANIQLKNDKLAIKSFSIPALFPKEGKSMNLKESTIQAVKWNLRDDNDSIVIVQNHCYGTLIESFVLKEQTKSLRKPFSVNKTETYTSHQWIPGNFYQYNFQTTAITLSRLMFNTQYFYLTTSDNTLHCLAADSLKDTYQIYVATKESKRSASKAMNSNCNIDALAMTYLGYALIVIDQSNGIFVYRLNNFAREPYAAISAVVNAMEFSIVNGNDFTDILFCVKPHMLDNIVDKLNENFNRQCQSVQQFFYVNFVIAKINLYRLVPNGILRAHDLNNLLTLHSILIAFKSLLRASDISLQEGPQEKLALALSESNVDVDKVLINLEAKDFTVESNILQNLKQLIQWVADLALSILVRLPEQKSKTLSYDISKDIVALNSIRELLVIIRIWGLLKPQCLPTFTRTADNQDTLANIYRLLTKLSLNPNDPDDILLDECCALLSQVVISDAIQFNTYNLGIASMVLSSNSLPISFKFNQEFELLTYQLDCNSTLDKSSNNDSIDFTCYLHFDKLNETIRKCTRCNTYTSSLSTPRTTAMRAWEQRWPVGCRCGGFWRKTTE